MIGTAKHTAENRGAVSEQIALRCGTYHWKNTTHTLHTSRSDQTYGILMHTWPSNFTLDGVNCSMRQPKTIYTMLVISPTQHSLPSEFWLEQVP